jgi:hypothetical protein
VDHLIELNLFLYDLLLDLVVVSRALQMQLKTVTTLFEAVLGAINAFMEDCALAGVRSAIRLSEFLFEWKGDYIAIFESKLHRILKFPQ